MSSPFNSTSSTDSNNIKDLNKKEKTDILEKYLLSLEILGHIKEFDKLSVVNNKIEIDYPSYIQGIKRRWYGDSRKETLVAINQLINNIFKFTDDLLNDERQKRKNNHFNISYDISLNQSRINAVTNFKDTNSDLLTKIMINLTKSISGLQNLKITYLGDVAISSQLEILISKIQNRIDKIKKLLVIKKD